MTVFFNRNPDGPKIPLWQIILVLSYPLSGQMTEQSCIWSTENIYKQQSSSRFEQRTHGTVNTNVVIGVPSQYPVLAPKKYCYNVFPEVHRLVHSTRNAEEISVRDVLWGRLCMMYTIKANSLIKRKCATKAFFCFIMTHSDITF